MYRILLSILVLYGTYSLTTYSHTSMVTQTDSYPTFSLGALSNGDVITFLIEFPNAATSTTNFARAIIDSSFTPLTPQPTNFGTVVSINYQGSHTLIQMEIL